MEPPIRHPLPTPAFRVPSGIGPWSSSSRMAWKLIQTVMRPGGASPCSARSMPHPQRFSLDTCTPSLPLGHESPISLRDSKRSAPNWQPNTSARIGRRLQRGQGMNFCYLINLKFAFSIKNEGSFALCFRFRKHFLGRITGFLGRCIRLRGSQLRGDVVD